MKTIFSFFILVSMNINALEWKPLLKEIVEINSGTLNVEGQEKVRKFLIPHFEKLGFETQVINAENERKVLSFKFKNSKPKVILIGHIDTVFEPSSPLQKYSEKENVAMGPGVNDMKGGIIMMLDILNKIPKEKLKEVSITLNDDEEIGSPHSAPILKKLSKDIKYGLIFEPTMRSKNSVTTSQSGVYWLDLKVTGKASHAGMEHEKGINACVELGHKIVEISKLTDYSKKLTVNTGIISGGTKANIVCEEATARIDIRYVEKEDLKNMLDYITKIAFADPFVRNIRSKITKIVEIPSLPPKSTSALFKMASIEAKKLGFVLEDNHMGGASDANQLAPTGMDLLVGLGPFGLGAHSEKEDMDLSSWDQRVNLSISLIQKILK